MANRKKDNPTATIYVGKPGTAERIKWDKFLDNCAIRHWNYSQKVRELCDAENQRLASLNGGEVKQRFDFERKKEERLKLKKTELQLIKLLSHRVNGVQVYEIMCDFAGIDRGLTDELEKVLAKAIKYKCDGSKDFSATDWENFIEYIEVVLQRRKVEEELQKYRTQNHKANA